MAGKRSELLADLHTTQQALRAAEKRSSRAVRRFRELEAALDAIKPALQFWSDSPQPDDANASRIMTVGQCRRLLTALSSERPADEPEPQSEG